MRFASLGSGSKGNSTVIQTKSTTILVDCGFSLKQSLLRLRKLNLEAHDIDAILVTHEHSDHISGVSKLAKHAQIPVWASLGTINSGKLSDVDYNILNIHKSLVIKDFTINPIAVPHDAEEPCQFTFESNNKKLGLLTDIGHITNYIVSSYNNCDALLLETNYDHAMLYNGPYPEFLKQRVSGDKGHLSNHQAAEFIAKITTKNLQQLVLMHISQKNNNPTIASHEICRSLKCDPDFPIIAHQDNGFNWVDLSSDKISCS